jgi:two-component system OmpR family response regulator
MTQAAARTDKILVVDDDARIRDLLRRYLTQEGFEVILAEDGKALNRLMLRETADLIVLDLMMPGEDGLSICRRLRAANDRTPIIMLTAKGEDVDRIVGLEVGADDYLGKPFNPRELLARIRAVLRRASGEGSGPKEPPAKAIRFAGWVLEPGRRRLLNPDGVEVPLTGGEYELLQVLVERPNRVLTRDMLMDLLRGRQAGPFDRAIDVAVSRLRRKLEDDGRNPSLIKTVRGGGYVLAATVDRN